MNYVYIGYDPREGGAYRAAFNSIVRRTDPSNLLIYPIRLDALPSLFNRPIERRDGRLWCPISDAPMATEFAISRFCVPFIHHSGWALFIDCDVICLSDISELFALADDKYAVMVVKHQQTGQEGIKMDNQIQTYYARKNWSSVVLWNCNHSSNSNFTPKMLNTWPGRDLHAFKWLEDHEIGELPRHWNWLIDVTEGVPEKRGIWHYTLGTPDLPGCKTTSYGLEWYAEKAI